MLQHFGPQKYTVKVVSCVGRFVVTVDSLPQISVKSSNIDTLSGDAESLHKEENTGALQAGLSSEIQDSRHFGNPLNVSPIYRGTMDDVNG